MRKINFKVMGGVLLSIGLCMTSGTTALAEERIVDSNTIKYEEEFCKEDYTEIDDVGEIMLQSGEGTFSELSLSQGALKKLANIYVEKGESITIKLSAKPTDKSIKYGIILDGKKMIYVYGKGKCGYNFQIEQSGNYEIFVANENSTTIKVEGSYSVM